jgi:hypothetical protein
MTQTMIDASVLREAVGLACRAPSLHNSQPWRWVSDGPVLHLFADPMRILLATDSSGREVLLSCGAVLDHLRVAMTAAGWDALIDRFPEPHDPEHLATVSFAPMPTVTEAQRQRADAILRRRTDRLPFAAPSDWDQVEDRLRLAVIPHHVMSDVVLDHDRPRLAEASRLTETLRRSDPTYESELDWWTTSRASGDGVPGSALVSASEAGRTDIARTFRSTAAADRRAEVGADQSKIFVLSTSHEDSRSDVLRCGEALSAVLLEGTLAGLATCTLTHMTELLPSREVIRALIGQAGSPQLLVRVGVAPWEHPLPATPRRPLSETLRFDG